MPRSAKANPDPATRSLTVREQTISLAGGAEDPGGDVDGDAADVVAQQLALAGVQAHPHLQPQVPDPVPMDAAARMARAGRRRWPGTRPRWS